MWWLERAARALALAGLIGLAACQVRPLYAPAATGAGPAAELPAIDVDEPLSREEQVFRNELLFDLRGGPEGEGPRYDLVYRLTIRENPILIERGSGVPNAHQLTGGVSFLVKDKATGASLFGASVTAADSYNRSSQSFTNIRSRRDAEDRLAKSLAELARARLAAFFATR